MLIEDDIDDQEIFCLALQKVNDQILCDMADDGVEAIERLKSTPLTKPDYIFIDVNMPRMDGLECLRQIKLMSGIESVRIFMFSTSSAPKLINNSKALGADGFIVKPASIAELTRKLEELFQN
jgi:CheY-like chemotaxis protein